MVQKLTVTFSLQTRQEIRFSAVDNRINVLVQLALATKAATVSMDVTEDLRPERYGVRVAVSREQLAPLDEGHPRNSC